MKRRHTQIGGGARLPTAAEWTLACQGNTKQRYPWGDTFDFEAVDYRSRLAPYAVGSREKNVSPVGVFDLVGNVWQWCADAYEGKDFRLEVEPTGTKPGAPENPTRRWLDVAAKAF